MGKRMRDPNSRKTRRSDKLTRDICDTQAVISEILKSVEALTQKVELLEERLQRTEITSGVTAPEYLWNATTQQQRSKPGRKAAYSSEELLARRDALVTFLEMNWPELRVAIRKSRTPAELATAFQDARKPIATLVEPEFIQCPPEYLNQLWQFLKSRWYCNNPRRLADALAGLPKLSWKRSFDICNASPCTQMIGPRARRDLLQRKFPQRLHELRRAHTDDEIVSVLRRSRTKDSTYLFLLNNPSLVVECLRVGKPGILS